LDKRNNLEKFGDNIVVITSNGEAISYLALISLADHNSEK
jgi:hypothetical protein